jgi:hypothetical protein
VPVLTEAVAAALALALALAQSRDHSQPADTDTGTGAGIAEAEIVTEIDNVADEEKVREMFYYEVCGKEMKLL